MDLKLIIGVVIVVIILYIIWSYFFTSIQVIMSFQNGIEKIQSQVIGKSVAKSGKNNYSFSLWVYVSNWNINYGQQKNILAISSENPASVTPYVFQLALDPVRNDLQIYVDYDSNLIPPVITSSGAIDPSLQTSFCKVSNFPIQSWVNISVSVYNRAVDVYIDGKLVRTCLLPGVANINNNSNIFVTPTGGFDGWTSKLQYIPNSVNPQEAWNIYSRGYSSWTNMFGAYQVQVSLVENGNTQSSITI